MVRIRRRAVRVDRRPRANSEAIPTAADMVLWRHLRTINEILIPKSVLPETSSERTNYARVMFRR